jgi:hypothetical protein
VARELRQLVTDGSIEAPDPGTGHTIERWATLALLGRRDLTLAPLGEGHLDAVSILHQAGRTEVPGALYGVWAARSAGTGAYLNDGVLSGTVRFCSGAHSLDRALIAALTPDGDSLLVDVDLRDPRIRRQADTWQAVGMDASDSPDIVLADVAVAPDAQVGPPGFYLDRPGFWWGGGGVAAVWYGGARGLVDRTIDYLRSGKGPDEHQLAHLGDLEATLRSGYCARPPNAPSGRRSTRSPGSPARPRCRATAPSPRPWPICRSTSASITPNATWPRSAG